MIRFSSTIATKKRAWRPSDVGSDKMEIDDFSPFLVRIRIKLFCYTCDVLIIGGGSADLRAAIEAGDTGSGL
jgi:hypothetical protein